MSSGTPEARTDGTPDFEMMASAAAEYAHNLAEQIEEGYFDRHERPLMCSVVTMLRRHCVGGGDCQPCAGLGYLALDDEAADLMPNGRYETCAACNGTGGKEWWR